MKRIILVSLSFFAICSQVFGQCADPLNIYTFDYNGHSYEVVKENSTWTNALDCALDRGGYLAEITTEEEQNTIFNALVNDADIDVNDTQNQFGTASIWIGGSDAITEGEWIWDGDNDGNGIPFWSGNSNGSPVDNAYTNWGTSPAEPDNSGGQDHLTIILKPTAVNFGLWNDLVSTNSIYYLIEYNSLVAIQNIEFKNQINIYPNPFDTSIFIDNNNQVPITQIDIFDLLGKHIKTFNALRNNANQINVADLEKGMYVLHIHFKNGDFISQKMVK